MAIETVPATTGSSVTSENFAQGMILALNSQAQLQVVTNTLLTSLVSTVRKMKDTLEDGLKAANLDAGTVKGNVEKKKDDGLSSKFAGMLDALKEGFGGLSLGTKSMLGIGALIAGLALMSAYGDELVEFLAPVLSFFSETLIPNIKELNEIILDQPGGYWTAFGVAGLGKTLINYFGKSGKIATIVDDAAKGVRGIKVPELPKTTTASWGNSIRTAFLGVKGGAAGQGAKAGLFGKVGAQITKVGTAIRAVGITLIDDIAAVLKGLTPTWLKVLKLQFLGGSTIYPIVKGGGKQLGIVGKVSQGIQAVVTSIKGLTPFATLAETLAALTPTWLRVLKLQILGGSTIYPITKGGGKTVGLVGKVSQSIQAIVTSIKGLNPFAGLGARLATLGATWKLAMMGSLFGTAAGPAGKAAGGGVLTKVTSAISKVASIITGIFSPTSLLGKFTGKLKNIFLIVAKALSFVTGISTLGPFLRLGLKLGKAIPVLGQIIIIVQGIFGFIKGAIDGFKTGGIFGAITGGLIGLWDAVVGSLGNLIADILGWIFTKLGLEKFGAFLSNLDFSIDGIVDGFFAVVDMIRGVIYNVVTGLKNFANDLFKIWNSKKYLPGTFDLFEIEEFEPLQRAKRTESEVYVPPKVTPPEIKKTDMKGFNVEDMMISATGAIKADVKSGKISEEEANLQIATIKMQASDGDMSGLIAAAGDGSASAEFLASQDPSSAIFAQNAEKKAAAEILQNKLMEAEIERMFLKAEKEDKSGGSIVMSDTSSKTQLNNTTVVSNSLSVDASDLVAAKLNMMLPAFR